MSFMAIKASRDHRRRLGGELPWYRAGGAPTPWAAYQPKGAASLAASYLDLSGNGNDAAAGTPPTWDVTNGWKFNGASTQYLTTTFIAEADESQSMICQFSNHSGDGALAGARLAATQRFSLISYTSVNRCHYANGAYRQVAPVLHAGNLAVAGLEGYRNGVDETATFADGSASGHAVYIGARNNASVVDSYLTGYIQALAIYDVTLTADQVAAVAAAMALL